jgi:hypothetical protein
MSNKGKYFKRYTKRKVYKMKSKQKAGFSYTHRHDMASLKGLGNRSSMSTGTTFLQKLGLKRTSNK